MSRAQTEEGQSRPVQSPMTVSSMHAEDAPAQSAPANRAKARSRSRSKMWMMARARARVWGEGER